MSVQLTFGLPLHNLYLIFADHPEDHESNTDLLVIATCSTEAWMLWKEYCSETWEVEVDEPNAMRRLDMVKIAGPSRAVAWGETEWCEGYLP
jgi:hypothetical protein